MACKNYIKKKKILHFTNESLLFQVNVVSWVFQPKGRNHPEYFLERFFSSTNVYIYREIFDDPSDVFIRRNPPPDGDVVDGATVLSPSGAPLGGRGLGLERDCGGMPPRHRPLISCSYIMDG